jgi:DNA-binding response OmpR family regulator
MNMFFLLFLLESSGSVELLPLPDFTADTLESRENTIKIHSRSVQTGVLYCARVDPQGLGCSFMSLRSPVGSVAVAVYRFEGFTLDLEKARLSSGPDEVRLRPKPFEALRYIVERSGRLISKDELIRAVWPDSFVSGNSLSQCFLEIALQDDDQRIIKTVSKRGYLPGRKGPDAPGSSRSCR